MSLFSIIIPVYNVEKYLDECLDSVLNQSYENFEVILVDDGSTDASGRICDEYVKKDSRMRVIHKLNGGLSSARNAGTDIASGEYVLFLDSDDYISNNYLEAVALYAKEKKYDMIIGRCIQYNDDAKPKYVESECVIELSPQKALENVYYQKLFDTNAWSKVMKADIVRRYRFVDGVLYEDYKNIHLFIHACSNILYMEKPVYFYRMRKGSIMNSRFDERKLYLIDIAQEHLDFVKENYPDILEAAIRRYVYSNFHILGRIVNDKVYSEKAEELRNNILQYKSSILHNPRISLKEKISVWMLDISMTCYQFFWNLFCFVKRKKI